MNLLVLIGVIAGTLTSLGLIWSKFLKPLGRLIRKAVEAHAIITSFPEWQERVDRGMDELQTGSGATIKDRVNRLSVDLPVIKSMIEEHAHDSHLHRG